MKVLCSKIKLQFYKSLLPTALHFNVKHTLWAIYVFNIALLNRGDQTHCHWELYPILPNCQINLLGRGSVVIQLALATQQSGASLPELAAKTRDSRSHTCLPCCFLAPQGNKGWLISTCIQKLEQGPVRRRTYLCLRLDSIYIFVWSLQTS